MHIYFLLGLTLASVIGLFFQKALWLVLILTLFVTGYTIWKNRKNRGFVPQSQDFKALEKVKKKRIKTEDQKYHYINDQFAYISNAWGYSKEQEKIVNNFLVHRAYGEMYNKLTASLLPQIITLIDNCNDRDKKGCKRDVSARIRELARVIKNELKKKKSGTKEDFEVTLEVYDYLLNEVR